MNDFPIYSPEENLIDKRIRAKGLTLSIKRDDMIHPFISGNKWRKLKYQLTDARQQGKSHLVSFGGAYSNHLLALAAAAAKWGFKCTGFVRGEEALPLNDTLFLCRQYGMELIHVSRESYRENKSDLVGQLIPDARGIYLIDEGGRSRLAVKGCAELVPELSRRYDHVFVACGTGTTLAGIAKGISERFGDDFSCQAEGIAVLKNADFLEKEIRALSEAPYPFRLHLDFHQGGYAKTNPHYLSWLKDFHRQHGLLLDPVYTGKMMYAIFQLAEQDYFQPGSRLLAIHTGGLFGLLGMKDRMN